MAGSWPKIGIGVPGVATAVSCRVMGLCRSRSTRWRLKLRVKDCRIALSCFALATCLGTELAMAASAYTFKLSASSSLPNQQSATPTGQLREVYFWVTCSDPGLSAVELGIAGTLTPLAFVPTGGVLNVGSTTSIMLAVPGCPEASDSLVLGCWLVVDSGGTLCAGESDAGIFAAVDCDPIDPHLTESPKVIGFSSNGSPPCTTGTSSCVILDIPLQTSHGSWSRIEGYYR